MRLPGLPGACDPHAIPDSPADFLESGEAYAAERITHSWVAEDVQITPASERRGVIVHFAPSGIEMTAKSGRASITTPLTITPVAPPTVMVIASPALSVWIGEFAMVSSKIRRAVSGPIEGDSVCADHCFTYFSSQIHQSLARTSYPSVTSRGTGCRLLLSRGRFEDPAMKSDYVVAGILVGAMVVGLGAYSSPSARRVLPKSLGGLGRQAVRAVSGL
jgi:hypothetical protein